MEEVKQEEDLLEKDKQLFLREFKKLKSEQGNQGNLVGEIAQHRRNEEILTTLHTQGVIEEKSNPVLKRQH